MILIVCLCCGAKILCGLEDSEDVGEDECSLFARSICISPSASASDSDESGLYFLRCRGGSWAGVDFGRGGGVITRDKSVFTARRCGGAAVAPEWRRGRPRIWVDIMV